MTRRRCAGDAGVVAGAEILPAGVLLFVTGTLLITNLWAVLDAKTHATTAAREAARAWVEAPDAATAATAAARAATDTLAGLGWGTPELIAPPADAFTRCARIVYEVRTRVPALRLPGFDGGLGSFTVTGRHTELVDPWRSGTGLAPAEACGA